MDKRQRLLDLEFPEIRYSYTCRDTMLYALGVGAGLDPLDPDELRFVYEKSLTALPTMAVTLAYPGYWYRELDTGLDHLRTVHASEKIVIHEPLPVAATVTAQPRVIDVIDKGAGKGALVVSERAIRDVESGARLATVRQTAFCRGDGGFESHPHKSEKPAPLPARPPDHALTLPTSPQAALICRLSGDLNPLHCDPVVAREAGFPRPILHGLATMGFVCRAAVRTVLGGAPERLREMDCRFTAPVYPGDTVESEFWRDDDRWRFRARVGDTTVAVGDLC
jgi:acyl dehydratase